MFPRVAGLVCSHGPYRSVKAFYDIPGLTARDKQVFKKYETAFTVLSFLFLQTTHCISFYYSNLSVKFYLYCSPK